MSSRVLSVDGGNTISGSSHRESTRVPFPGSEGVGHGVRLTATAGALAVGLYAAGPAWASPRAPGGGCGGIQAEVEPNGTAASATPINLGQVGMLSAIYGTIATPGDEDWFSFQAQGGRLFLSINTGVAGPAGSRDSFVSIFAADGTTLLEEDDDDGTGNGWDMTIESLDASLVAGLGQTVGQTYYARVRAKDPGATIDGYSLQIDFGLGTTPEIEPNDTFPGQQQLSRDVIIGSLSSAADVDWYAMTLLDAGFPFMVVDGDPERDGVGTDVTLLFDAGATLLTDSSGAGGPGNPPAEGFVGCASCTGYVRVTGTGPGTYAIGGWYSSDFCPIPVELQSFRIE